MIKYCCLDHLCILDNSGPKIEPWGTPASIGDDEGVRPFKKHLEIYHLTAF